VKAGREATAYTVSEGQGYGMIIVALMAGHDSGARTLFDGLWEFSLDHRSEIDSRLMDWKVEADEQPDADGNDSAFDGDCSLALALLLAEKQWGNAGRFDYGAQAAWVMGGILASTGFLEGPNDGFYYYYSSLPQPTRPIIRALPSPHHALPSGANCRTSRAARSDDSATEVGRVG
jgi:hypothetical protein